MFSKLATLIVVSLGALSASAVEYSCGGGPVQCCGSIHNSGSYDINNIASLVGVAISTITGQIGLECNPITAVGAGTGGNW